MKPYIIGIAGESGVGKSTIASIISIFYGDENAATLSTDDLHKWERGNPAWSRITHLNPEANNLELGDIHIADLSAGKFIFRSVYSHKTGTFEPPLKINPKHYIINEGLHAFYTDTCQSLTDLKIFVDTNDQLRTHWKIIRDTEERGYKYNEVLDAIEKRREDSEILRAKQLVAADVVVEINSQSPILRLGDKHELVPLSIRVHANNDKAPIKLLTFIRQYMSDFGDFIKASEIIGHDVEMCQNGGGNISIKSDDFMIIKASGFNMKDVHRLSGYSVLKQSAFFRHSIQSDSKLNSVLTAATGLRYKRPSMETGMHLLLKKCVVHAHPIYSTLLLCLDNSEELHKLLFPDFNYQYIPYVNPGYELYDSFHSANPNAEIYFLENHGVVVSSDSMDVAVHQIKLLNELAKDYLSWQAGFEPFTVHFAERPLTSGYPFPDSVMFANNPIKAETIAAHNYINIVGSGFSKVRHLSDDVVHFLRNMESEKYRQAI